MKRIGLIGLSMVLWALPAQAHEWMQIAKESNRSVQIDVSSIESDFVGMDVKFIARSVLPFEDADGVQVYAFQYEVQCWVDTYRVLEAAGYDRDGRVVFFNGEPGFTQMFMRNSMMSQMKNLVCPRRR